MIQKILKKQEEELNDFYEFLNPALKAIIKSYNAKIIKAVCDEMTGKKLNPYKEEIQGYNDRIDEEIEIAKTLLT